MTISPFLSCTLFRPGVVLGRNGGMIPQIYLPFFLGLGGRMGDGGQPMPWIHVKDLSGLIKHAVEDESMEGVYNAVAPQVNILMTLSRLQFLFGARKPFTCYNPNK